ncbi:hypothetical protein [Pseudomonas sp.]|uniref:hypothetical protein n=1 Tax=Pseudomonas sp. TaxID=306 RepID=UPI0026139CE1|nr:hypothetical protein [Pseudomonas sp.]
MKTNRLLTCFFSLWLVACAEQQLEAPPTSRGTPSEWLQEQKPQAIKGVQPPADVLEAMNRNYGESQNNCREYETSLPRGHYYCSGVLLRTVEDGNFNPWTYSPSSIALGATSYSWIRQDVSNKTLYHPAGFILRNKAEGNSHGLRALETGFICLYPFDAGTLANPNNHQGCGVRGFKETPTLNDKPSQSEVKNNNPYGWGSCDALGITTATQWNAYLTAHGPALSGQCSWNIESQSGWSAMIASRPAFPQYANVWNEILLNNKAGDNGDSLKPFIAAFFYDVHRTGSLAAARNFQTKLNANGYNVPILRLDFTAAAAQRFAYVAADQAVPQ